MSDYSETPSEIEERKWYEEHANDHIFYIYVRLSNNETDKHIMQDNPKLPVQQIVEWFKERYQEVKSFYIRYEWKLSLFHRSHLFQISYTPEEMATFLEFNKPIHYHEYMLHLMQDVLFFADRNGNYPIIYDKNEYLVFPHLFSYQRDDSVCWKFCEICDIKNEDEQKKILLFEELIPKAWHPDRALQWCI